MEHLIPLLTGPAGALVTLLTILYGGVKKWWVFGWAFKDAVEEKNEWKRVALRGTTIAERAVTHQEKKEASDAAP